MAKKKSSARAPRRSKANAKKAGSSRRRMKRPKVGRTQSKTYKRTARVRVTNLAGEVLLSKIVAKTTSIGELLGIVARESKGILMFGERKLDDFLTLGRVIGEVQLRKGATLNLALLKLRGGNLRRHATFDR